MREDHPVESSLAVEVEDLQRGDFSEIRSDSPILVRLLANCE